MPGECGVDQGQSPDTPEEHQQNENALRQRTQLRRQPQRQAHRTGGGRCFSRAHQLRFLADQVDIPGLDGGHAAAVVLLQCPGRRLDHGGIGAVAGKGGDARAGTGGHQNVII